jgi:hypothetical protein
LGQVWLALFAQRKLNGEQLFDESGPSTLQLLPIHLMEFMVRTLENAGGNFQMLQRILYSASGYQGQKVFIIPSKDMVIVRLGLTDESQFDINEVLKGI